MRAKVQSANVFQFSFPGLGTKVVVEEREDKVLIRATRNTFSVRHKILFLRFLAAEGFIPDRYQQISSMDAEEAQVCWLVDYSSARGGLGNSDRSRKIIFRLLGGAVLFWLGMIVAISFRWI